MSMIDTTDIETRLAARITPESAGEIVTNSSAGGLVFANAAQMMEFARMMAVGGIAVPKHLRGNVGTCLAICIQAYEWKMSPFAVANKSYSVNDRLAYESQLVQAVILTRAPIKGRIRYTFTGQGAARICKASATLADGTGDVDYESPTIERIPTKNSPLWKNDPDQQLTYYSGRALCRRYFPDILLNVYTDDELRDTPTIGAEKAKDVTPPKNIADRMDAIAAKPKPQPTHDAETGEVVEEHEEALSLLEQARNAVVSGMFDDWRVGLTALQTRELAPHIDELVHAARKFEK